MQLEFLPAFGVAAQQRVVRDDEIVLARGAEARAAVAPAREREHEFADVLAWVASLANQMDVDLTAAVQRYATGCPRCAAIPCACS